MDQPIYYEPPEKDDKHIQLMFRWLIVFFVSVGVLILLCIIFATPIARALPFSVEKRFVRPYEVMAERWFSDDAGDPQVQAYLEELVLELAEVMDVPENYALSVHYVESVEANAFATLGGHIVVLRGLLDNVPDENSLSMILAHEISHIKNRDPLASMGRGVAIQMMLSYFTGNSQHSQNLSSFGGQLGLLSYSREQERRSDLEALDALNLYYGHVSGYDTFFQNMMEKHPDDDVPGWLQTHPDLVDRVEAMDQRIEAEGYTKSEVVAYPDWFTKKLSEPPAALKQQFDLESLDESDSE